MKGVSTPNGKAATPIHLEPNQVYIKRPGTFHKFQTLVEGTTDWTYVQGEPRDTVALYYQGWYVTRLSFQPCEAGNGLKVYVDKLPLVPILWKIVSTPYYTSLAEAVATYEQDTEMLACIECWNKRDGLEEWCMRESFTPRILSVSLELPPDVYERLENLSRSNGTTLEELMLRALYRVSC